MQPEHEVTGVAGVRGRPNAPTRTVVVVVAIVVLAVITTVFLLVASAIDSPSSVAGSTTSTTWSEPSTYCVGDLEHRIFIGPTNGTAAPSIEVVAWDPTCRP